MDLENELRVTRGEGGEGELGREVRIDVYTLLYLKWRRIRHVLSTEQPPLPPTRTYCIASRMLLNVMKQPKWTKNLKKNRLHASVQFSSVT